MEITHMANQIYAAAQPNIVYSPPVESNGYTVITASEVMSGGGFGYGGSDAAGNGGGGGGGSSARPVAVIVIGPDGVTVRPVFDASKVALAGVTAWGAIAITIFRMLRKAR